MSETSESDNHNVGWRKCKRMTGSLANYANNQIKSDKCGSFCQVFSTGTKHQNKLLNCSGINVFET